jgi:hypothetical protein
MGLLGFLRGRSRARDDDAVDVDDDGAWEAAQPDGSPYRADLLPPLEPRAPRDTRRRPKLTDADRHVFQYARNMTAHNVW